MAFLELDAVKTHLRLELGDTSHDDDVSDLILAAARRCELATGRWIEPAGAPEDSTAAPFSDGDLAVLRRAALLMIREWFDNGLGEPSENVIWLLTPLQDFSDR